MIERIWHGWTTLENAQAYENLLKTEIFVGINNKNINGYRGIKLLTRKVDEEMEFITIMKFDSIQSIINFAGKDYENCVVPESAQKVLKRYDKKAQHYELKEIYEF